MGFSLSGQTSFTSLFLSKGNLNDSVGLFEISLAFASSDVSLEMAFAQIVNDILVLFDLFLVRIHGGAERWRNCWIHHNAGS